MRRFLLHSTMHYFSRYVNCKLYYSVCSLKDDLGNYGELPEPCYVAAIAERLPKMICGFDDLKLGGCFVHQRPYVAMENLGSCELGDLLVLCRKVVDGKERFNACLFQVKKAEEPFLGVQKPDNSNQLTLYTEWPRFCFGHIFNEKKKEVYDYYPKCVTPGAQYMFINDGPLYCHDYYEDGFTEYPIMFTHSIPSTEIDNNYEFSFGRFLWYFINWQIGKPFDSNETASDAWSRLIWDAINKTRDKFIPQSATLKPNEKVPRNNGDFFDYMLNIHQTNIEKLSSRLKEKRDNGGDKSKLENYEDDSDGAISILYIEIGGNTPIEKPVNTEYVAE